ncbi:hypothetical protein C8J56DRAFT_934412 [Mycena floridula]|nr:hypothetical protein C8J56DRAFT_934412 [Mycena floridula]
MSATGPDVAFFLNDVNCRHIASFVLGAVFIASIRNGLRTIDLPFIRSFFSRFRTNQNGQSSGEHDSEFSRFRTNHRGQPSGNHDSEKASIDSDISTVSPAESRLLSVILAFCFASASLTVFASLMTFDTRESSLCSFVIAWGGISLQTGRIVGLVLLLLDLRRLHIRRIESVIFIVWLLVGLAFVFVNNALAIGVLMSFPSLLVAFCMRTHFLPASLTASLLYIILEISTIIRFWSLVKPLSAEFQQQMQGFRDFRIIRTGSLLFFELLTLVPSSINSNTLGEVIPFCIGALLVLEAFKFRFHRDSRETGLLPSSSWTRTSVAPTTYSLSFTEPSDRSAPVLSPHPFSSRGLANPTRYSSAWLDHSPPTARSSRTIDSVAAKSIAKSIKNAVVQVAKRSQRPMNREPDPELSDRKLPDQPSPISPGPQSLLLPESPLIMARPQLLILTSPIAEYTGDIAADTPAKSGLFRLTPHFAETSKSHLSMSSSGSSHSVSEGSVPPSDSHSTVSAASIPFSEESEAASEPRPAPLTRTATFGRRGVRFRAAGYANPIQSRWSSTTNSEPVVLPAPLPLPDEWPRVPPLVLSPSTGRPRI